MRIPTRTLQLRLKSAGTSYRDLKRRARLDRAQALLRADQKLAVVALDVGFSTPQHFATWFKRQTGVTPSDWRNRQK